MHFAKPRNNIPMEKPIISLLTIFLLISVSTSQTFFQIFNISNPCIQNYNQIFIQNPSLNIICYEKNITQIHITSSLSWVISKISLNSLFSSLSSLETLKVLSLVNLGLNVSLPDNVGLVRSLEILNLSSNGFTGEIPSSISNLINLQSLILDNNNFSGEVPSWLNLLPNIAFLSLSNNSLSGTLPLCITKLENLRVLWLSRNSISGEVPDFRNLKNLQVLDLGENKLGPHFPKLYTKLVTLVLRDNKFSFSLPPNLSSFNRLRKLDISLNEFVGQFSFKLFSLPLISYVDISRNKFTGRLFENTSCSSELVFVDLSMNRFMGKLPRCLKSNSGKMIVKYGGNCLSEKWGNQRQHKILFCHTEAIAVNVMQRKKRDKKGSTGKIVLSSSLAGGIFGGVAICFVVLLVVRKLHAKQRNTPLMKLIVEKVPPASTIKILTDARYISETTKLAALGLPPYRTFSLDEVKEATNNFSESNLIGEGSHGKVYKGTLSDGTLVAIRSLKMKRRKGIQFYRHHVELFSKLRHRYLVCAVGHCFECYPDDSNVSTVFLIFEFVPNGTLRGYISEGLVGQKFSWKQRIEAAIGVASGIQFLHTGIVPGLFSNNLKISDILLDHDHHAKISNYNLPLLADEKRKMSIGSFSEELFEENGVKHRDNDDIYDLGVILLEIILGRVITSESDVTVAKDLLQVSLKTDDVARRSILDPAIHKECTNESIKTMMAICLRCLSEQSEERASVEDVLWNLQFAAQVQVDSSCSNQGSPIICPEPK